MGHAVRDVLRSRASRNLLALIGCLGLILQSPGRAEAAINIGPWTFDDRAFADQASQIDPGTLQLGCATTLTEALTGYSPGKQIYNIGASGHANHFQLGFSDFIAVNQAGAELVFFDARASTNNYEIAVRPQGGAFTSFRSYPASVFVDTGSNASCGLFRIYGTEVDLSDFGLAPATRVDALQFRCTGASPEGDPIMAGVLQGTTSVRPVPALAGWGMVLLVLVLLTGGLMLLRRTPAV